MPPLVAYCLPSYLPILMLRHCPASTGRRQSTFHVAPRYRGLVDAPIPATLVLVGRCGWFNVDRDKRPIAPVALSLHRGCCAVPSGSVLLLGEQYPLPLACRRPALFFSRRGPPGCLMGVQPPLIGYQVVCQSRVVHLLSERPVLGWRCTRLSRVGRAHQHLVWRWAELSSAGRALRTDNIVAMVVCTQPIYFSGACRGQLTLPRLDSPTPGTQCQYTTIMRV